MEESVKNFPGQYIILASACKITVHEFDQIQLPLLHCIIDSILFVLVTRAPVVVVVLVFLSVCLPDDVQLPMIILWLII